MTIPKLERIKSFRSSSIEQNVEKKLKVKSKISPGLKQKNDWSQMPPEMFFMIFNHLVPEDQCMKEITETCKKFKEICESRLTHLHLDFEAIKDACRSLVSHRAYKEISVVNFEMPVNMLELLKLFQSSVESVRKLNIGDASPESSVFTPISREALRFLFRCFPNVEELKIFKTTMTQISNIDICKNDLPKLKRLHLHDVTNEVIRSLKNVTWLEELRITGCLHSNSDDFKSFVTGQNDLKLLETRPTFIETASTILPTLRTFIGVACAEIENLFEFAPNMEHLELTLLGEDEATNAIVFLRRCRSETLTTLNLIGYQGVVEEFLENFPSLEIAKCSPNLIMSSLS